MIYERTNNSNRYEIDSYICIADDQTLNRVRCYLHTSLDIQDMDLPCLLSCCLCCLLSQSSRLWEYELSNGLINYNLTMKTEKLFNYYCFKINK